ncbi:hypothetical protein SAMN04488034_102433 [Salinimicrobium catena]|uniref:Uncharacterized protein n=1 Tax=Salinimicrobium catena TaxID=390640 RepID=A0A1H5LUV6_9FLAO|nr:DUF6146 family protein [Salinimicrobium catena]SDL14816.1 hypothetical protein SAMN04488140_102433 [Salinimicrobium catena]SEE80873.1 hypothetical protein SAMN04488034_102433 [Salinimicrobium catena]
MKNLIYALVLGLLIYSCSSTKERSMGASNEVAQNDTVSDTVRIANDSLEYEIIIIDPGYSYFLNAVARPEGYHSQSYLENKNRFLVSDYNQRVREPFRYNPDIYTQEINYDPNIDYGYDVNYKLYNYFVYLSQKYNQRFSVPTRL